VNTQEAFDLVLQHLWNQNHTSRKPFGGMCAYRGQHGAKCAIGCLIPDDIYHSGMEGDNSTTLLDLHPEVAALPALQALCMEDKGGQPLHVALQSLHDQYILSWPPSFRHYLRAGATRIARRYKLTVNLPKE
jgi:hypothetical protein